MQKSRRQFIQNTGAGAVITSFAIANSSNSANETINIGCIGLGGRFRHLLRSLIQIPNVKITALCDVWDGNLERTRGELGRDLFATRHHEEVLTRNDVDAVMICTSNQWHVPITVDACEAGKDVYVEKPLTINLEEGKRVIDAQNNHKRVVQVGMQQRSMTHLVEAMDIVKSGVLGKIHKVHLTWNRNSPSTEKHIPDIKPSEVDWQRFTAPVGEQPFDPFRLRHWRWTWDFGGGILTDLMVHYLDVAHWYCDVDHPTTAATIGDHITTKGIWETPDTIQTLLHYPEKQLQIYFEGTFINARNRAMMEFMGTEATLYADRGRYELIPESDRVKYKELILGEGGKGADFYSTPNGGKMHLENWIDCIRTRKKPSAPAEAGVSAASGAHLGNLAYRNERVERWGM